ncbi:hypothetical protein ACFLQV_04395 [Calditrichota bacterium]
MERGVGDKSGGEQERRRQYTKEPTPVEYKEFEREITNNNQITLDEYLELRKEKSQLAKKTWQEFANLTTREQIGGIGLKNIQLDSYFKTKATTNKTWRLEPVKIDSIDPGKVWERPAKRGFKRRYLILKNEIPMDSITVSIFHMLGINGFVRNKTFVSAGKPVVSYSEGSRDKLWVNGVHIIERYEVDEAIMPCYFNDKLFFVFRKGDSWGWCYDGEMHENVWDQVRHYYGSQGEHIGEITNPNMKTGWTAIRDGISYTCRPVLKTITE